jgi:hypothetical protein
MPPLLYTSIVLQSVFLSVGVGVRHRDDRQVVRLGGYATRTDPFTIVLVQTPPFTSTIVFVYYNLLEINSAIN